jgi:outer membrane receptor for ferric coprogen and ferric-rhodotorulic acid
MTQIFKIKILIKVNVNMKKNHNFALTTLVLAMGFQAHAEEVENNTTKVEQDVEQILIVGKRTDRDSKGATGLTMEISETPQSISMVTSELLENFAANSINDALKLATGITVVQGETNRTSYTSRGFDIKSTQIDGVGMPNSWGLVTGAMESYGYEEIEVIRGANGQLTGVGNSSGTINYVRKRPTNKNEGEIGVTLGSYNEKRLQADYSMLLTESGSWAARVVAVVEDSESYLNALENDRTYISAVIDGQLTDNSTLTFGASHQDANTDGNMWGGLVLNYADGTQAEWDVSTNPAQDWTSWDTTNTQAFIEYVYALDNDWEIKTTYNFRDSENQGKLLYVYDAYGVFDSTTNLGLVSWPGRYDGEFTAHLFDLTASGEFDLLGKTHELTMGVSNASSESLSFTNGYDYATTPAYGFTPAFPYASNVIPEPIWGERTKYADIDVTLTRGFASTKLNITDELFVVAGFNAINYKRNGVSSGVTIDNDESEVSPYIAATYAITDDVNIYAGYSDIYQPQEQYDYYGEFLDPSKGVNYEVGVKTQWFDDSLLATFAVFKAEQQNIAAYAGLNADLQYYYEGTNINSSGFEMEVSGNITDNLNVLFAYTLLDIEDEAGESTNPWVATDVVNFSLGYTLPSLPEINVGFAGKWQSETKNAINGVTQDAYMLVNAFARWELSEQLTLQANIDNVTDEKYITALEDVGYYGAPVNGSVSVSYSF